MTWEFQLSQFVCQDKKISADNWISPPFFITSSSFSNSSTKTDSFVFGRLYTKRTFKTLCESYSDNQMFNFLISNYKFRSAVFIHIHFVC